MVLLYVQINFLFHFQFYHSLDCDAPADIMILTFMQTKLLLFLFSTGQRSHSNPIKIRLLHAMVMCKHSIYTRVN